MPCFIRCKPTQSKQDFHLLFIIEIAELFTSETLLYFKHSENYGKYSIKKQERCKPFQNLCNIFKNTYATPF